ncbi:hypothetical protein OZX62_05930 [Bifidobacterium sp. ESL0690]|uniref:hypothetical protein n=1 Tax=Bifidobacterium sp. ESL0690 TaxID=2983214 RepID=UPI0023F7DDC8|nr:hypothetical protein [Bifidobacterium sp. ESL0690]WEV46005.1 hypothetical protein OZX62_05930 [Bifidobacterium sp. ESL0690]
MNGTKRISRLLTCIVVCLALPLSLGACGDDGSLPHGNESIASSESAKIKDTGENFFKEMYEGDSKSIMSYASKRCSDDTSLAKKYDLIGSLRLDKNWHKNLLHITQGIEKGKVVKGDSDSSAILTSDAVVDLGFAKEDGQWKIDYQTCKSVAQGGFIKDD